MRALLVGGFLILLIGGWFVVQTFWNNDSEEAPLEEKTISGEKENDIPLIAAEVVRQKILNNERVRFLDMRDEQSYETLHIPHSLSLSSGALGSFVSEPNEILVIVLSWSDAQAKEVVTNILRQTSYPAFLLEGGFEAWKAGGNQTIAFGDPNSFLDQSKVTYISPAEALTMMSDDSTRPFILDVQPEQNFKRVHLKGAVNIPLRELEKRSEEIPPAKNIIVYGESELTSFQGGVRLADLNFFNARTLHDANILRPESKLPLEP